MILATGEGQLVFLVIMAVIGVINWVLGKLKAGGPTAPPAAGTTSPRPASPESEEERLRRFLEALGIPAGEESAPPRRVPPIVAPPPIPVTPRRPTRPTPTRRPVEEPWHPASLDEMPAPTARVEQISLPELRTPPVREFDTLSSRISALPMEFPTAQDEIDKPRGPTMGETLQRALASPQQLRSAFVLSEVFGTPPGLR